MGHAWKALRLGRLGCGSTPLSSANMKISEILEATTKYGDEITFKRIEDSEGDNNRGWQVDRLDAYVNGKRVGHLKMSYIPKERYERYYPTILNFISSISGHVILPYKKTHLHYSELSDDELRETIRNGYHIFDRRRLEYDYSSNSYSINGVQLNDMTRPQLLAHVEEIIDLANENFNHNRPMGFKWFKKYYVNKPIVDFIKVDDEFQRQGIGFALYKEGSNWMREKGMKLYASSIQSDDAKAAWKAMHKYVKKDKRGSFLDFSHETV